ncbi:hypothetical protein GAH_00201 [Geoglobus ahangari]|uniref:Uncharacterized protein n=1 Tax=Geoglobus ahangari TaxID=113653 RepID=A0A0F7IHM8_9EURY|nr:hypothetical protein [Geoglobus ahangari]AKG92442.1 hypothetical protein GAH_00201 [Geoglobus ahangari]NOY11815.1 hypothetical protein [Archaeoglobi archaeon]
MYSCEHKDSGKKEWLPSYNYILRLHTYCGSCGTVKNVTTDRGRGIGYFSNVLSRMRAHLERKGYKVGRAQIRLVLLEFESSGFADPYSVSFSQQKEVFAAIVRKYVKVTKGYVMGFME